MANQHVRFQFYDGFRSRSIDPLEVIERYQSVHQYRPAMIDQAINGDSQSILTLSEIVRFAFDVSFINERGRGMTRLDCVQLAHRFDSWIRTLQTKQQQR
ncbi:hypothetical protein [Rhodopirellula bahusiensis]|uniref:Uncharacterized protein n=1 Tax=Rhodopirellula bahusiensis TaxID=2014065 RepID=A0A2G1W802_9BACT|nr:hypothetical protein [Rhodopirellula bahusiensis]PHQ35174.1 hypothetical protein CEE69_12245 [Rhodopirellula bahusiensis]